MKSAASLPTIAVFDFDGTITTKDSLWDFLFYSFGKIQVAICLIKNIPILIRFLAKKASNEEAKEKVLGTLLAGMSETSFQRLAETYSSKRLPQIIRQAAIERMNWHITQGDTVLIISASLRNWIEPWANKHSVTSVLATTISVKNGMLTGKLSGKNCYGQEKVNRLLEHYPHRHTYRLFAYGDGKSDREILAFADQAFYRRFS